VRDRRLEPQAVHLRAQFARGGDELFAFRRHEEPLQLRVAAVAEATVVRVLAAAPRHGLGLRDFRLHRREARAFVRAIAKRLAL